MHFELIVEYGVRQGFNSILLLVDIQLYDYHLLKRLFSPLNGLGNIIEVNHTC